MTHSVLFMLASASLLLATLATLAFQALDQRATVSVPGLENLPVYPDGSS